MPTILDIDFTGTTEPKAYPGGKEYKLRLLEVRKDTNKNDDPYIMPRFEIVGKADSKDFTKYLPLPTKDMGEKKVNLVKFDLFKTIHGPYR